jgi:hypothetical protein
MEAYGIIILIGIGWIIGFMSSLYAMNKFFKQQCREICKYLIDSKENKEDVSDKCS